MRNLHTQLKEPSERIWFLWTHMFSCSVYYFPVVLDVAYTLSDRARVNRHSVPFHELGAFLARAIGFCMRAIL